MLSRSNDCSQNSANAYRIGVDKVLCCGQRFVAEKRDDMAQVIALLM
ncbi:hypothetical protein QN360_05420 [Glaciimonas sp. CA11.2]|nr:hypothetical protein [Glaciimonas sp. CA11.2]